MAKGGRQEGFTLPEVLIALFVLTLVLLAMATMVFSVMRATSQSKEVVAAVTLMQDKSEALRSVAFASLTTGNDSVAAGGITYTRQWNVTSGGNFKTIVLTVSWEDRGSHSISTTTLRGE